MSSEGIACKLRHLYGSSYLGSGGCSGRVNGTNIRTVGTRDNGFVSGPDAVEPVDPTQPAEFNAAGGGFCRLPRPTLGGTRDVEPGNAKMDHYMSPSGLFFYANKRV